jgi:hypothetical protein
MKSFVGLSAAALSLAAFAAVACSSSSSPTSSSTTTDDSGVYTKPAGDAGNNDENLDAGTGNDASGSSNDSGSSSDASCAPAAIADGGVPVFTAPTLGQKLCASTDISTFVTACNSSASGSTCGTWAQGASGTTACGKCLFDQTGSVIAPLEILKLGTEGEILPSIGSCVLASAGSAAAACAAAADENDYCVQDVCSACGQTTFSSCATTASTSPCSTAALQSACSAYQSITESCITSAGSTATLTAAANAICGSGPDAG